MSAPPSSDMRTFEELMPRVRERLGSANGNHRFRHTLGVIAVAEELARVYGADVQKARIAALLHDATKHDDPETQRKRIAGTFGEEIASTWPNQLLHGFSAVVFAKEECGVEDPDILAAIQNHSVGRPGMSLLEKIIFAADYLEPGRGADPHGIRDLATTDLNRAVAKIIIFSLEHVRKMGYEIVPLSWQTKIYYEKYLEDFE